jgi:hypothetical protein
MTQKYYIRKYSIFRYQAPFNLNSFLLKMQTHCGQRTGFCGHIADTADNIADTADNINIADRHCRRRKHQPTSTHGGAALQRLVVYDTTKAAVILHHNAFIVTRDPTFPTFQTAPNPMSVHLASREPARVPTSSEHRTTS